MAANFNFEVGYPGLIYKNAQGETIKLFDDLGMKSFLSGYMSGFISSSIAPEYEKKTYPANSLVSHISALYYNPNAISTPENWNKNHWTQTTIADYIKLVTT